MSRVAVIAGAGPAGLTAAFELLSRTDIRPIVVEPSGAIGGLAQTYAHRGNRIDIGGHRFFSKSDRVMRFWASILPPQGAPAMDDDPADPDLRLADRVIIRVLDPRIPQGLRVREEERRAPDPELEDNVLLQRRRLSRIYHDGNFFPYPLGITLSVALRLGLLNTAAITTSYLKAQLFPQRDPEFLDAFFTNRFGRRLYETFFRDYTEKVWGRPCREIRADWGAQRIKGLSLKRAFTHAIQDLFSSDFRRQQAKRETSLITRFWYPKLGPGQMWETVAAQVGAAGGEIRRKVRVQGVHFEAGRVVAATLADARTGETTRVPCDVFLSTMPLPDLVAMCDPAPPEAVQTVARGLCFRDFLTVGLLLRRLHLEERGQAPAHRVKDNWIYIQDGSVRVGRIQIFNNWSPYLVADPRNTTWVGLEYFVGEGDDLWRRSDEDLLALATRELKQLRFARGEDVLDGCVLRMPKAYPAYFGTYDRLATLQRWVTSIPNLYCVGRNGMHRYNNQDHSMLTAMLAVDHLVDGRPDDTPLWQVNLEGDYHEGRM